MKRKIFFENWDVGTEAENLKAMLQSFEPYNWNYEKKDTIKLPKGAKVEFAFYDYADYSGRSYVIFTVGDKVFENYGSHCSCYGLEGQWTPEESSWEFIAKTVDRLAAGDYNPDYSREAVDALVALVKSKVEGFEPTKVNNEYD